MKPKTTRAQLKCWPYCCKHPMIANQKDLTLKCSKCGLVVEFKGQPPDVKGKESA